MLYQFFVHNFQSIGLNRVLNSIPYNPPENSHHLEVNCNNPLFYSMRTLHLRFHSQKSPKRKNRANSLFRACVDPHIIKRVPKRELAEFLCLGLFLVETKAPWHTLSKKTHCYNLLPGWPSCWQNSGGLISISVKKDLLGRRPLPQRGNSDIYAVTAGEGEGRGRLPPPRPAGKILRYHYLLMAFPCI